MCIIIAKPAGTTVDFDILRNCWDSNPHGAGIAYAMDGQLVIEKGFMTFNNLKQFIIDPIQWEDVPMLIHFRIATQGSKDKDNTHPFEVVPGKLAFAHNGMMTDMVVSEKPELSDTNVFCRYVLKQLPHNFLNNSGIVTLIYNSLGGWNKLAFLDNEGNITIFNESDGCEEEGVWYSNEDYLDFVTHLVGYHQAAKTRATVRTVEEQTQCEMVDEWYCQDCATWFDARESQDFNGLERDWGMDPACPLCGTNDSVSFDPLDIFEESSKSNPLTSEDDDDLDVHAAQPWHRTSNW